MTAWHALRVANEILTSTLLEPRTICVKTTHLIVLPSEWRRGVSTTAFNVSSASSRHEDTAGEPPAELELQRQPHTTKKEQTYSRRERQFVLRFL